jgi:hypothetical protein
MTRAEASELVALLALAYPSAKFSEGNAQAYEAFLLDLPVDRARVAIEQVCQTSRFLPAIAEIRAAALSTLTPRAAAEAWGDVVQAIRRFGVYRAPSFGDPVVAYAVDRLGWRNVCLEDSSDASLRARFCEIYDAARDREHTESVSTLRLAEGPVRALLSGIGGKP